MKRIALLILCAVLVLLGGTSSAFAASRTSRAASLRALAAKEQNNSLRYLHTTWFNSNYSYTTIPIASIPEATGTADATGTIEVLNPPHGFSMTSSEERWGATNRGISLASVASSASVGTTRRQASASYATALALVNGTYNPSQVGVGREEALRRTVAWTNALAISHARRQWGEGWQSALWAYYLGAGSQRVWSALPTCTQELVTKAVAEEADRLLAIPPPYYRDARGRILTVGDSKAEENGWNAALLFLAARVYASGDTTKAAQWEAQGRWYALTAFATPNQVGKDLRIQGSNLNSDGTVTNHRIINPDYIVSAGELQVKSVMIASWTNTAMAPEARNGLTMAWRGLTKTKFRAGKYAKPGGTIYRTDKHGAATANIYYPQHADWSKTRRHNDALMDVAVFVAGHDYGYGWARAHIGYVLRQQARHKDGRVFSAGETRFTEEEQFAAVCAAEMVESLRLVR